MKKYLLIALLISATQLFAQEATKKFDVRFGIGQSLLGSGDMITLTFENELNYKISNYFSGSVSLNYGKSISGVFISTSYIQENLNVFISPFKNTKRNNFRIGAGLSVMTVSDFYMLSATYGSGGLIHADYQYNDRNSFGYNIIIEDDYSITDKFLVGLKLFTQPYSNGDINSGILLKFGLMF